TELQTDVMYICRDDNHTASICWQLNNKVVPFIIDSIYGRDENMVKSMQSLWGGKVINCACTDLDHIYEVEELETTDVEVARDEVVEVANRAHEVIINGIAYVPSEPKDIVIIDGVKYKKIDE